MIYIKDSSQDKLDTNSELIDMEISGDQKVIAAELTMILYQLYNTNRAILAAAFNAFF